MVHIDHIRLIRKAIIPGRQIWADFGSGQGAFTLALRDVAGPDIEIYSIDKDEERLQQQKRAFGAMFPESHIHYVTADFTEPLYLPFLDGILAANSLHYVKERVGALMRLRKYLKPQSKLVIVEYNVDHGNRWVPYPFSFETFTVLCEESGFEKPQLLETEPSHFLDEIYSAVAARATMQV